MSGFDLAREQTAAQRHEEGRVLHVSDPVTGAPAFHGEGDERKPVTITVAGRLSQRYRDAERRANRAVFQRRRASQDPKDAETYNIVIVAGCIIRWDGFDHNGQPFPYSEANAEQFVRLAPRLRAEMWQEIHDDAAFFEPSSTG